MAAAAAMQAALTCVGFSQDTLTYIINHQGISNIHHLIDLIDEAVINLCKGIHCPGSAALVAGEALILVMPSPFSHRNLNLVCYSAQHKIQISCTFIPADIMQDNIDAIQSLCDFEDSHKDPDPPKINKKDWPHILDVIEDYLSNCYGTTGIPLAYSIDDDEEIPAADPTGDYQTSQHEMITHKCHYNTAGNMIAQYKINCTLVHEKLKALTYMLDCWSYVYNPLNALVMDGRLSKDCMNITWALTINNVDNFANTAE